jgi:thiamine kinase-like enzyme
MQVGLTLDGKDAMATENRQQNRYEHQLEVKSFLQNQFNQRHWEFTLPHGYGNETYKAESQWDTFFVKLGSPVANYEAMASLGLSPQVITAGSLADGTSILVQPFLPGRIPNRQDFHIFLEQIAAMIGKMHHSDLMRNTLSAPFSEQYGQLGLRALAHVQQRWARFKSLVPAQAAWVDEKIAWLASQLRELQGSGTVASHNDICNANWMITPEGRIYIIDLDAMSIDDPAADLGAILWWYYPPGLRKRFIEHAGFSFDKPLRSRMRLRMAIHCLHIILPRAGSYDQFTPAQFPQALADFKAVVSGEENPQGYN